MSKVDQIKTALASGNSREALRLAAAFPYLGPRKADIVRGWEACVRPELYRQMGKDVEVLIAVGVDAVRERYAVMKNAKTFGSGKPGDLAKVFRERERAL